MQTYKTNYGTLHIGDLTYIFHKHVEAIEQIVKQNGEHNSVVGLTGGSTPKAFYLWAAQVKPFSADTLEKVIWSTSDERCVPLESEESNFGQAQRGFLQPLGVANHLMRPWPVDKKPEDAAAAFEEIREQNGQHNNPFSLCLLGMGEDCHTASLFPGSPLLKRDQNSWFAAVEAPGKGWRLTLTPHGIKQCPRTLVTVTGAGKAEALRDVLEGEYNPQQKPAQLLRESNGKVDWLVDAGAASKLAFQS